ncbi:MAG TPA: SPOR domain-containing protein, partial [bacterium]|nr:SPOR domain-containing protein [bacterium]
MSQQDPQLSTGYRTKLSIFLVVLFLSIPAAIIAGGAIGGELMRSLREQMSPEQLAMAERGAGEGFSPYGLADPTKAALGDLGGAVHDIEPEPSLDAGEPAPGAEVLEEAPEVTVESFNLEGADAEPLDEELSEGEEEEGVDPEDLEPSEVDREEPEEQESIFELGTEGATYKINLGSFLNKANAEAVVAEVTRSGYSPSLEEVENADGDTIYRVMLGPMRNYT